jgi:hypothetical protein
MQVNTQLQSTSSQNASQQRAKAAVLPEHGTEMAHAVHSEGFNMSGNPLSGSFPPSAIRSRSGILQPKLQIGAPNDSFEHEADAVADQVVQRMSGKGEGSMGMGMGIKASIDAAGIQRKCAACEEEAKPMIQRKLNAAPIGSATAVNLASTQVSNQIQSSRGSGGSIDMQTRTQMERHMGHNFSQVRIHTGEYAAAMSRELNAKAFTVGNDIYFNTAQYQPQTEGGVRLLAHELTHTVHQGGGSALGIQRTVDKVEVNCGDMAMKLHHDGTVTSYALSHCNVDDGTYNGVVTNEPNNQILFGFTGVAKKPLFDFQYKKKPDQKTPNEIFGAQTAVQIVCTHTASPADAMVYTNFSAKTISAEDVAALTGVSADAIPDGQLISVEQIAAKLPSANSMVGPVVGGAGMATPTPWSFVPRNTTGVLWTPGHASVFSKPAGAPPAIYGYRGNLLYYGLEQIPLIGKRITMRLNEGVPGSFANDAWFPSMPGEQIYMFQSTNQGAAEGFAGRLRETTFGGNYQYSPPRPDVGPGVDPVMGEVKPGEAALHEALTAKKALQKCANNCITVPSAEIEAAVGGRPKTTTGVDVMTGTLPDGSVDPTYQGRAKAMRNAMGEGPLPPGAQRLVITSGAAKSMFILKRGGNILLVYGIYTSTNRIVDAVDKGNAATVVTEEAGSWALGLLGSALGTAGAAALVCAPSGPITLVCVVGGFVGGLAVGAIGAAAGHAGGNALGTNVVQPAVDKAMSTFKSLPPPRYMMFAVPTFF